MSTPVRIATSPPVTASVFDVVWNALGQVIDPELGIPITDLGLVYGVDIIEGTVTVAMTTTTPVCPLGSYIKREIERLVASAGIEAVEVAIVHSPPWTPAMMNDTARHLLGWD